MSSPPVSDELDLNALIAQTQSRLATSGPSASSDVVVSSDSAMGLFSPGLPGASSVRSSSTAFFTPPVGGRDAGVLGESFAGGGVPSSGSSSGVFSMFQMSADVASLLCCGVAAGSKFCTLGKATCTVRQHAKKFSFTPGAFYIAGPRNKAFQQVSVEASLIPARAREKLILEKYPLETWQRLFAVIAQAEEELGEEEFENLKRRIVAGTAIGLTPRKGQNRYEEERESWERSKDTKLSPIGMMLMEEVQEVETEVLAAQLDKLLVLSKDTASGLSKLRMEVGSDIDRLELAVQEVACKAGTDPGLADAPMLSAWDGVAYVNHSLQEAKQTTGNLHNELAASRRRVEELESKDAKTEAKFKEMENRFSQVETLAKLLFAENKKLAAAVGSRPAAPSFSFGAGPMPIPTIMDTERKFVGMENYIKGIDARLTKAESTVAAGMGVATSDDPERIVKVNLMEAKLRTLEARVSSKPVTVAGRTFLSLPDVEAWVIKNAPGSVSYLYYDCVSLLESINATDMSRSEIITDIYQTQKVGLKAEAEARQIASFRLTLPSIFCGNQKELTIATAGKHFPGCKTYAQWNAHDGYSGLKFIIERGLIDVRSSIKHDIDSILEEHPEAKSFANDIHGLTHTWIMEYVSWLDSFITELKTISGCTIEDAYELGTKCGKRVFEELRRERSMAANANAEPNVARRTAKYLLATLRAHALMQEFLDRGFRDHTSIFPVINFHLYQTTASRITLDKYYLELKTDMKRIDARCNQIDTLSSKVQKLSTTPGGAGGGGGRGRGGRGGSNNQTANDPE